MFESLKIKIIENLLKEALWEPPDLDQYDDASFDDYFTEPLDKEDIVFAKKSGDIYYGRNVAWIGEKGRMFKVDSSILSPAEGNIFDFSKMAALKKHIEDSEETVYLPAPIAQIVTVGIDTIKETQIAYRNDRLHTDYDNISYPFSLGDDELDLYLASPKEWHEDNCYSLYSDYLLFRQDPKLWMKKWSISEDSSLWTEDEKEEYEDLLQCVEKHEEIQKDLEKAIQNEEGDLGSYWVDLRDGNHRAFGALAAGEPYVWVIGLKERTEEGIELQ